MTVHEYYLLSGYAWHAAGSGQRAARPSYSGRGKRWRGRRCRHCRTACPVLAQARESATRALERRSSGTEFEAGKRLTRPAANSASRW